MRSHHSHLSIPAQARTRLDDAVPVLVISGEIDMNTVDAMLDEVDTCLKARPQAVILDLSAVTFLGSAGLRLVLHTRLGMEQINARLAVVAAKQAVLKPLQITEIDRLLNVFPSLSVALDALDGDPSRAH